MNNEFKKGINRDLLSGFKGIKIEPRISTATFINPMVSQQKEIEKTLEQVHQARVQKELKHEAIENEKLQLLKEIRNNTGNLVNIMDFIRNNANHQTEIMIIISEIMLISTAQNEEEAVGKYRQVMDKINTGVNDIESVLTLSDWANAGLQFIKMKLFGEIPQ